MRPHYQMHIHWSDEDDCYLVHLPEFDQGGQFWRTHGQTYEEAAKNGEEVLELLIENYQAQDQPLPEPQALQVVSFGQY